ncbi:hypothetical protein [Spiroplasma endosymbiont of Crioceris asparagi]|uniref:hypothetical protein n=1 Tax=Spiroplasma endosymbiont of Crioceris asparagi TaxID=3066286 RepID=UPI0030D51532
MIYTINELLKNKKIVISQEVVLDATINEKYHHPLVSQLKSLKIDGQLTYQQDIDSIFIDMKLEANNDFIDARDGKIFNETLKLDWKDDYLFLNSENNPESNFIIGDKVDVLDLAINEVFLNIPINFSKNYGNIKVVNENFYLLSEEDLENEYSSNLEDPRWDKLKELKSK